MVLDMSVVVKKMTRKVRWSSLHTVVMKWQTKQWKRVRTLQNMYLNLRRILFNLNYSFGNRASIPWYDKIRSFKETPADNREWQEREFDFAKEQMRLQQDFVSWQNTDPDRRVLFPGGMERSSSEGKTDYLLVRDGPMYERWAAHLNEGAKRYEPRNWMKASGEAECLRFRESAVRHFEAWLRGDQDEDHAAAVFFNINGAEYAWNNDFDRLEAEFDDEQNIR